MIHRSEQTTPTSKQTHQSHIEPIGANNIEREEREREKERDEEDKIERVGESEHMREKMNKISIYIYF